MKKKIKSGVYLVVDPGMSKNKLLLQLEKLQHSSLSAVQIWDNFAGVKDVNDLLAEITQLFKDSETPLLINNHWQYLESFEFDGIHFDQLPADLTSITQQLGSAFLKGITLTNDLDIMEQADKLGFDYISFCSVFPSATSNSCELVRYDTVKECRKRTQMPLFLSGGITPEKINLLEGLEYEGVAVVSGIMKAEDPLRQLNKYLLELEKQ